ncbi:Spore germination protein YaaH [Amycolatopsis xylanica]|uniref:Spore germination protein YaaH n=1 Tax=Amycolatopsis xylanica TaxID=589385 RepID=A0A1H3FZA8_9PSEU|nr:glycosyl hydrolase family 18 protein [Amycolatopsis xylanica]SDX96240.1 Spore germination protein YaaH [Amycolatopsis xylanica]
MSCVRIKRALTILMILCALVAGVSAPATGASGFQVQAWLYPGPSGSATCSAKSEYADGRARQGVLKAEYYTIDRTGTAVRLSSSNPDYACNGYSRSNAEHLKANSSEQYVTVSLSGIAAERALTGDTAKVEAAVQTLTRFTADIGFTGVDIDFENYWDWTGDDAGNFYDFLSALADALHDSGLKLQVEGPPDLETEFNYGTALAVGADEVVMMAYDAQYHSPAGGPCLGFAPYDWMEYLVSGALAQIPASRRGRFVAGLPSEAYISGTDCENVRGNLTLRDVRAAPGFSSDPKVIESRRDPASGEIRWTSGGRFYDYVDQKALDSKLALVRGLGVTKVSVWALGGGNPWFSASALH